MAVVVDAQIVKGFFQESVLEIEHELTGSPGLIFDRAFRVCPLYMDNNGMLLQEWRTVVEPEWFDVWYADQIRDGLICEMEATAELQLRKKLSTLGFPVTGRDIWYARLCNSASKIHGFCFLISEDLDFYQPSEKNGDSERRQKILLTESGQVRKYLNKDRSVYVKPVLRFVEDYQEMLVSLTSK